MLFFPLLTNVADMLHFVFWRSILQQKIFSLNCFLDLQNIFYATTSMSG